MNTITVSSKYQIVIPKEVRKKLGIRPGTRLQVNQDENSILLTREPTLEEIPGLLKGMKVVDAEIRDETDRELP